MAASSATAAAAVGASWLGDFEPEEVVGQGGYGLVYRGHNKSTRAPVAIKVINLEKADDDFEDIQQEITILASMRHPHIVEYFGSFTNNNGELWIIMEYLNGGSCRDVLDLKILFPEECAIFVLQQLFLALRYLHSDMRVHRDIKAANMMLHSSGTMKLVDFGVSAQMSHRATKHTFVGTPFWIAPEVIKGFGYNHKADIWSAGITIIELLTGSPPYVELDPLKVLHLIPKAKPPTLDGNYSKALKELTAKCLVKDAKDRPDIPELLKLKIFQKVERKKPALLALIQRFQTEKANRPKSASSTQPASVQPTADWDWDFQS